jgi:hypothetical protein
MGSQTNLFHTEEGPEQSAVLVAVGAFADPNFPPQDLVYECRKHAWVRLPKGVEAFDKDPV